jgi:predicted nuclease of restriction endonuclease-like (RecB) superfamily
MPLINEFADWFSPKAPVSYRSWFGRNLDRKLNDINNAYMTSFNKSLFDVDMENIAEEIVSIRENIENRNEVNDRTFAEYDRRTSNGIPKAIINNWYIRFLENYTGEEDKAVTYFSYEKDLQNSLISQAEELFPGYKIFGNNNEGIEYNINGKRIDLLLEHKTENKLLVVELKAGMADYKVFGQISMYIGPLMQKYPDKEISGVIIAGEIDESLKMAISAYRNVRIMSYKMKLTLEEIM